MRSCLVFLAVLGCSSSPDPSGDAVGDDDDDDSSASDTDTLFTGTPLEWGVADSCGSRSLPSDNLWQFYDGEPKLIVHGEGPEELALAEQVRDWYADVLGYVRLVPASELTAEDREDYDLWVLGGSEHNALLTELNGSLPVRFEDGSFVFGGYRWDNPAHGIALYHPNPWNPARDVLVYGGNTTDGAYSLFTIYTGTEDFHVTRARSPQMEGGLCREGRPWTFVADRAADYREAFELATADWLEVRSARHVFHYAPGSTFAGVVDWLPEWQESEFDRILDMLEVDDLDHPVHWWMYESNELKGELTGSSGNGHADVVAYEVHAVYTPTVAAVGAHEDVHVVQHHRIGDTRYAVLGEGMAVMVDGTWHGVDLDVWAAEHLASGDLPGVQAMIDDFWGAGGGSDLGYGGSGAFNRFLYETYGVDALKELYLSQDLSADVVEVLGADVSELEAAWHARLEGTATR